MTSQETDDLMYVIGRIYARLVAGGAVTPDDEHRQYELVSQSPAHHLPPLIARLVASGKGDSITALMAQLPAVALPMQVSEAAQGSFGLGYYHQKGEDRRRANPSMGRPPVYDEPRTGLYLRLTNRLIAAIDERTGPDGNRTAEIERLLREALGLPPLGSER